MERGGSLVELSSQGGQELPSLMLIRREGWWAVRLDVGDEGGRQLGHGALTEKAGGLMFGLRIQGDDGWAVEFRDVNEGSGRNVHAGSVCG